MAGTTVNPLTNSELYDHIVLAGVESPGLAVVSGAVIPQNWDKRKGFGNSGATIVYSGDDLAEFKVTLSLFEIQHFEDWDTFQLLLLKSPKDAKPKALDINHPLLAPLGIKSVVVKSVSQLNPVGDGMWQVEISFLQFRAPTPSVGKPTGSTSNKKTDTSSVDERDKTIAALRAQAQGVGVL